MKWQIVVVCSVVIWAAGCLPSWATDAWPAEPWNQAVILTGLDPDFQKDMSGASWNPTSRTFWVCSDGSPSAVWALREEGANRFAIAMDASGTRAEFTLPSGDFEGICQADYSDSTVFLLDENGGAIREYDVSSFGIAVLLHQWDISSFVPTSGKKGPEGITFVPNQWLKTGGFVDSLGNPYTASNGMGGVMLVAHQNGGRVYAFDLDRQTGNVTFVGAYLTLRGRVAASNSTGPRACFTFFTISTRDSWKS